MKYTLLAVVVAALTLTACEYKKHPMDKPPPSASVERDSAPNFDDLDQPAKDEGSVGGADAKKVEPGK
jgi:hypothetical protein